MADFFKILTEFFRSIFATDKLPLPTRLADLQAEIDQLSAVEVDWTGGGIDQWLRTFRQLMGDDQMQDTVLVRALQLSFPRLAEMLTLLGIAGYTFNNGQVETLPLDRQQLKQLLSLPSTATNTLLSMWLNKITNIDDIKATQIYISLLLFEPIELLKLEYRRSGFASLPTGQPDFTSDALFDQIKNLINSPFPIHVPTNFPADLQEFLSKAQDAQNAPNDYLSIIGPDDLAAARASSFNGFGFELKTSDAANLASKSLDLGHGWHVSFTADAGGQKTYRIVFKNGGADATQPSDGEFEVRLSKQSAAGRPAIGFGPERETHIELQSAQFAIQVHPQQPLFTLRLRLERAAFVLTSPHLKLIAGNLSLPKEIRFESDINVAYLQGAGLQAQGSEGGTPLLGVQFAAPLDLKIGTSGTGLSVNRVQVRLEMDPVAFEVRALIRFAAQGQLGPVQVQMDGVGVWFGRWQNRSYAVEPPTGFGIALDAGPISGGGFLARVGEEEYAGALQVKILGIGAFAFGIYKRMANGAPSFIALLGIRLPFPGIQLSWGFALTGIGGLVGVNRRADTDVIRDRLASGTAGNVLFTDDPVKNAPMLLNDMRLLFPDEPDIFLVGPTLQLNWGYLLFLDLGVFIELPGPRKIFIAGSAHMLVGSTPDLALVYLRLDFIGGIDFIRELIFFDAALVNSHVLQILDITGGVALRVGYGANSYFLFSVGGFHSSFNPGALELPKLARAGASLSISVVADIWLKLQMYLAVTPNTLQLGANIEAGIALGPISAHGWFKFDALIQFTPFYFEAEIDSGFDIEVFGESLYGVRVSGSMSGPGPIVIHARARVKLLFVPVSGSATVRLGKDAPSNIQPITDLVARLQGELTRPQNLHTEGEDTSVVVNLHAKPGNEFWLAPVGELIWEQKRAPLKREMQRFEGVDLATPQQLEVTCSIQTQPESDWFSFGTYTKVSEAEALNNARFTQEMSGVRVQAGDFVQGMKQPYEVTIDLWKLPERQRFSKFGVELYMLDAMLAVARERSSLVTAQPGKVMIEIKPELWNTFDQQGGTIAASVSPAQGFTAARHSGGIALNAVDKPVSLQGVF